MIKALKKINKSKLMRRLFREDTSEEMDPGCTLDDKRGKEASAFPLLLAASPPALAKV